MVRTFLSHPGVIQENSILTSPKSHRTLLYSFRHMSLRPRPAQANCSLDITHIRHCNVYSCYNRHYIHVLSDLRQTFQSRPFIYRLETQILALCHEQVSHIQLFFSNYRSVFIRVFSSVLADTLLLYRCYAIWGCKVRVVLGPIILLVAGTGIYPFSLSRIN